MESDREAVAAAEAAIQQAEAALETTRINLGYTRVTAPISGRIGKSNVTDGALVTAYQALALASIQQIDPIYVDVPQSTTELLRLKQRSGKGPAHNRWGRPEKGQAPSRRRNPVSIGRHAAIPRRHGGPDDRVRHPADGIPQPEIYPPSGNVCPGRGAGRDCRTGHPGPPAGGDPRSQGKSHRVDRGRRRQGSAADADARPRHRRQMARLLRSCARRSSDRRRPAESAAGGCREGCPFR